MFLFSEMKFGLLLLFFFLYGFVSSEKVRNEVKDEPTVADEVDNNARDINSEGDNTFDDGSKNEESFDENNSNQEQFEPEYNEKKLSLDESNSNTEQFDFKDEKNDVAENVQDQGEEDSKLEDPAPWRPKRFCEIALN